jgi:trans-aconitate 2-methyltransferase
LSKSHHDPWNPDQYAKFHSERERPFLDLVALIRPMPRMCVVDLGCGTGRLTRRLHTELQASITLGIDRSSRMLAAAVAESSPDGVRFEQRDITAFPRRGERVDLIFSNAALHWVDDHVALFDRLASALTPDGQLAVQMPAMHHDPSHLVAMELSDVEPFRSAFGEWRRSQPVLAPEAYARLLFQLGFRDPIVRLIVYPHVLSGPDAVVEWMKGTLLAEYSRHLPAGLFTAFVEEYGRRLLARIHDDRPFFFPFKRILMWAQRRS